MATIQDYLDLITSEHNQKPKFMAVVALSVQPFVDNINLLLAYVQLFNVDLAVGQQLDFIGQWVGVTRYIKVPLANVYFQFDTAGLGFNQGSWFGPGDSLFGITTLADAAYRTLIKAKIVSDHWDGTVPGAYAAWAIIFPPGPGLNMPGSVADQIIGTGDGSTTAFQLQKTVGLVTSPVYEVDFGNKLLTGVIVTIATIPDPRPGGGAA